MGKHADINGILLLGNNNLMTQTGQQQVQHLLYQVWEVPERENCILMGLQYIIYDK
jgi:hypothetical protein